MRPALFFARKMLYPFFIGLLVHIASASALRVQGLPETKVVKLQALDGSIKANFLSYGAYATNLWVKDKEGQFRDLLLGYDNLTDYKSEVLGHPNFGPIVGRYANRIRNGTFSIPISDDPSKSNGSVYHIPKNENGFDTLHGGDIGYDRREWSILSWLPNSVTFGLKDPNGTQGFPGTVYSQVTYTLLPKATWHITIHAEATEETPIMLSGHHYWNLEAYAETQDLVGHIAQFNASRVVATDSILVPNGNLLNVSSTPLDFRTAKSVGDGINASTGYDYCGAGCVGFDNCWIYDDNKGKDVAFSIWSENSGIKMDVITNQPALQLYTCDGLYNASLPIPRKASQGGPSSYYENHSCFVLEQQSYIDGINHPNFGVDQIYGPNRPYFWDSKYIFSVVK